MNIYLADGCGGSEKGDVIREGFRSLVARSSILLGRFRRAIEIGRIHTGSVQALPDLVLKVNAWGTSDRNILGFGASQLVTRQVNIKTVTAP